MSVKFNVIQRGNPGDPQAAKKFYPSIVATGKRSQRQVAVSAAKLSALEPADMAAAAENFLSIITDELSRGNIVDLGEFGSFWLRAETKGADTEQEVNAASIKAVRVRFTPGKAFKEMLEKIDFEKA